MKFASEGFHAFVLRYSLVPSTHPTQLLEAALAMNLIRKNAEEWHINPQNVAIIGFSAGGHVAANLATHVSDEIEEANGYKADEVRPNALMLAYPVISAGIYAHKPTFDRLFGNVSEDEREKLVEDLSLEKHVDSKTPPVFIWQTVTDQTVPVENSIMFIDACVKAGVNVEAHLFPKGPHGLALAVEQTAKRDENGRVIPEFVQPEVQQWIGFACDWLRRTFNL